jgi:hypothetical protein
MNANAPYSHLSSPGLTGRPSIPETLENNREAAAYWIGPVYAKASTGPAISLARRSFSEGGKPDDDSCVESDKAIIDVVPVEARPHISKSIKCGIRGMSAAGIG